MRFSKKLNFSIQKRELEFLPALYLLMWGMWVLNPWVNSFASSAAFTEMGQLAPEWLWGIVIMAIGLFQTIVVFTENCKLRADAALLSMFTLFSMSMLVFYSNFASTAGITYLVIAICAWLGFTEILADVKNGGNNGKK
jgi:uncharacterized membrane protein HdeD (DUF308 family)